MAITNQDRVGKAMELLRAGLAPFVEREFKSQHQAQAAEAARRYFGDDRTVGKKPVAEWDVAALLKLMWEAWNEVFGKTLGRAERSLVQELRDCRNKWAHQEPFSSDDADRALDSMARLLTAVSAPQADEVNKMKLELRRLTFDEQVRSEKRKAGGSLIEAAATGTLKPWREIVTPHADVASGRYQQAEFAADLWQVHLGEGSDEYRKPHEFFRRTYLTESLKRCWWVASSAFQARAAIRLCSSRPTSVAARRTRCWRSTTCSREGAERPRRRGRPCWPKQGVKSSPVGEARRAGREPRSRPATRSPRPTARWCERYGASWRSSSAARRPSRAWLADDEKATNPGDILRVLFKEYGPCLILIDEWVAYARQLHDQSDLPGGGFETQFTFAQALTESAKLAGNCFLVVSLPVSEPAASPHSQADDVEVGGIRGREALDRLGNVVGRIESPWRPATADEGFEIVRRRLFEPLGGSESFKQRDVTARAFADLYRAQRAEFPSACGSTDYEKRIQAAFPIHPEILDRLYNDWSTLVKFQRTRGVLRLMAAVIHSLWEKGDRNPLILPSTIPIDDSRVQPELTRYLAENWAPIIEKDVDGPSSLPLKIDADQPNLGKLHATRRVARTIYLGSAPTAAAAHRGIEDRWVKLGCVMPGESPAIFGDALRRLAAAATFLYQDGPRFWYATQPTVTKLAEDRAEQLKRDPDKIAQDLDSRLRADLRKFGDFSRIHPVPRGGSDVSDDLDTRLVVLPAEHSYSRETGSAAEVAARAILESRGNAPRLYRNTLVFLAADKVRMQDLDEAVRRFLAWRSIIQDKETLNLDRHQERQALEQQHIADGVVSAQLPETYQWVLVPEQKKPGSPVVLNALKLGGNEALAVRASKKLRSEELLITILGSTVLRKYLDEIPLWRGGHVSLRQLVEDFATYSYLPRLAGPDVLVQAIRDGVGMLTWQTDTFAYAESYDAAAVRYRGLRAGQIVTLTPDSTGLLVKPALARRQLDSEVPPTPPSIATVQPHGEDTNAGPKPSPAARILRRFHGTVSLNPERAGLDASRVADEVVVHLVGLVGAEVRVTLEIEAVMPGGAPEKVVRTVMENARTLKFEQQAFEEE